MIIDLKIRRSTNDVKFDKISYALIFDNDLEQKDIILQKPKFTLLKSTHNIRYSLKNKKLNFKEAIVNIYRGSTKETYHFRSEISFKNESQLTIEILNKSVNLVVNTKKHHYQIHPCDANSKKKVLWFYV